MTPKHCPCLSGDGYDGCCGRYHCGEAAGGSGQQRENSRFLREAGEWLYLDALV